MIRYDETAIVTCVDNNKVVTAEVLNFIPKKTLSVSLERSVKLVLKYSEKNDEYQGDLYGRTFVSKGPKGKEYVTGRGI
jgi:hypothetical protein